MVQSILTRFETSLIGVVLLVHCLLASLACVTPFPIENLEEGMAKETVREKFGAPEAMGMRYGALDAMGVHPKPESYWTYVDEKTDWGAFIFPPFLLSIPVLAVWPERSWNQFYLIKNPVVLDFEAGKLVQWRVTKPSAVQTPESQDAAFIAIKAGFRWLETHRAYFVRLEEGGDPLSQPTLIPSNYFEDGYAYLLNARPGRYAAVAVALLKEGGTTHDGFTYPSIERITLLPADAIRGTLVEVDPGSGAFMGAWTLSDPTWTQMADDEAADAAQRHYFRLMATEGIGKGGYVRKGHFRRGFAPDADRGDVAWLEFLHNARKRLGDVGWSGIIDQAASAAPAPDASMISLWAFTCEKPFALERDCSWLHGPRRRIEVRGVTVNVAGSADGRTIALMKASMWDRRFPPRGLASVEAELRAHDFEIQEVTPIGWLGTIQGYVLELDGDGYAICEALSR
jgi:hypothetical protein